MNRDETVALFLQGKEAWNAWAEKMLAERKAMVADGRWVNQQNEWGEQARADFSKILFLVRGLEGTKEAAGESSEEEGSATPSIKSIYLNTKVIDFVGFIFPDYANFYSATFSDAYFANATFSGNADFKTATFSGNANFYSATFSDAYFANATFSGNADFKEATFSGDAYFENTTFSGDAYFDGTTFSSIVTFCGQTFTTDIFFNGAKFEPSSYANFSLATFERVVQFEDASFEGVADFNAVWCKRTFSMARARFKGVPDFIQAHFEEAPRLDNVVVEGRLLEGEAGEREEGEKLPHHIKLHRWLNALSTCYRRVPSGITQGSASRDRPARWRALKRLAIQGHDTDRELQFFSGEIRSQRFAEHWPLPWPVWKLKPWGSALSFWAGLFYQMFSNFGRSLARPFAFWLLAVVAGAIFYAAQSPSADMVHRRHRQEAKGAWPISSSISGAWHAALSKTVPCYTGEPTPPKDKNNDTPPYVGALSPSLASGTDVANEAWHLAFRNAFIILDGSPEAAHRTYGCLYGVELYGGSNPLAVVPSAVSTVSAVQKLFSALMIFLFGLALRNMLKMK